MLIINIIVLFSLSLQCIMDIVDNLLLAIQTWENNSVHYGYCR